ncbi:hypothetical protein ACIQOW_09700 [Kitasatospora sp. NPDC091335]|uniref:hypothetical protein n=1 Tax=Kitasatospora sp. NPDC091335 TaxID=3364085 RepID=UPI003813B692
MSHNEQAGRWDDVFVDLNDGTRWSATIITLAEVETIMERWAATGEALGGAYFSCSDGLIVRDAGISKMTQVLVGLFSEKRPQRCLA